ncbi:MAG: deoxyribonuclease IV [Actinobacteria bacterium]|nr:deoxyribonuclease IV [Actinomycetota bacterium]
MASRNQNPGGKTTPRLNASPRLGIHIRTAGGLVTGARHALEIGCTTFQIMSGNPSAWNPGELDRRQAELFRLFLDEHDLRPVFLHAGYLINLSCRTGRNAPLYAKSFRLLQATIERASALSCEYVVVHMGSRRGTGRQQALESLVEGICRLEAGADPPALLLENGAGAGDTAGATFEELAEVLSLAAVRGVSLPLGICLDTAHMWGAGYDLGSGAAARRLVDDFDKVVGINRLHLIHLNDSPVERGAHRDKHEHIGQGLMSVKALEAIVRHPGLRDVAMILETPGKSEPSDQKRMDDLRALAGE